MFKLTLKQKLVFAYRIFFQQKKIIKLNFNDLYLKTIIKDAVYKRLNVDSAQKNTTINLLVDEVYDKIKSSSDMSASQKLELVVNGNEFANEAFWFHSQLSGLVAVWEFKIRFLGIKLGIKSNEQLDKKSKQNKANASVQHKKLSDIIKEINKKTNNRMCLKLSELNDIRDSIIHCNPQAMKNYSTRYFGKQIVNNKKGGLVVFYLSDMKATSVGDLKNESEIESQDLYTWFVEVFNSGLPMMQFDAFDTSVRNIDFLIYFISLCFDERAYMTNKVFYEGKSLDDTDAELFQSYLNQSYVPLLFKDGKKLVDSVNNLFTLTR